MGHGKGGGGEHNSPGDDGDGKIRSKHTTTYDTYDINDSYVLMT